MVETLDAAARAGLAAELPGWRLADRREYGSSAILLSAAAEPS